MTRRSPVSGDSSTICGTPPGAEGAGNATNCPSGDQSMPTAFGAVSVSLRSDPPSADISMTDALPDATRTKAIRRPSGDHTGQRSAAGSVVRRTGVDVPTSIT